MLSISLINVLSLNKRPSKFKEIISGWGNYPQIKAFIREPKTIDELKILVKFYSSIARGKGRSYGDSSINELNTIKMSRFNRFLSFDENNGLLVTQAGVVLDDVIKTFLPKGWFPHVTPGTKFVTIGGMVASDIHGKNHYIKGSFQNHIKWIDIINYDGEILRCSSKENSDLFNWTIGGMGLTGIILNIAFYLNPIETSFIKKTTLVTKNILQTIELFENNISSEYSVAWIDCYSRGSSLGRSLLELGEHTKGDELEDSLKKNKLNVPKTNYLQIPFYFPEFFLNNFSVRLFNFLYYNIGKISKKIKIVNIYKYFYPLDRIQNWNKIYGKNGFAQFQCVIPLTNSKQGISELLYCISNSGSSSFLAVLKRFGKEQGFFSFPMEGYSLALDFPINKKNLLLMESLDKITVKYGGRFYLAKDSRLRNDIFEESDKRIKEFRDFRKHKLKLKFNSCQSKRLDL